MKITNSEVLQANQALNRLMEIKLPVKISLDIALVTKLLQGQVQAFSVVRDKLYKTYTIVTEPGETNGQVVFKCKEEGKEKENLEAFQNEFNELLEAETEELKFRAIQLPTEVNGESLQIEPSIMVALTKFVEIE